jgi:hypothetical protein
MHYNLNTMQTNIFTSTSFDIYQILVVFKIMGIYTLYILDTNGYVYSAVQGSHININTLPNIISMNYNIIDKYMMINTDGIVSGLGFKVPLKNIIKKAGIFILNKYGELYIELNNGYIHNPITKKYINYNRYFNYNLFSNYKYHKLNIKNVKDVTIYGDILDEDGKIWRFDWNTMNVHFIKDNDINQIVNFVKNNQLFLIILLNNGEIYMEDELMSSNDYAIEIHVDNDKLIYLTNNNNIIDINL